MRAGRWVSIASVGILSGGCAGARTAQTIDRLQATIEVLDQRVTQLERASVREVAQQPAVGASSEAAAPTIAAVGLPSSGQAATAAPSWVRPSTREIQQALKNTGFYQGPIDGKKGPMTREAIRAFQRVHGLTEDGIVGRKTWAQLAPYQDLSAQGGELVAAETVK